MTLHPAEIIAKWMIEQGYTVVSFDTIEELLDDLEGKVEARVVKKFVSPDEKEIKMTLHPAEIIAKWMESHGYTFNYGDPINDMLASLEWQAYRRAANADRQDEAAYRRGFNKGRLTWPRP